MSRNRPEKGKPTQPEQPTQPAPKPTEPAKPTPRPQPQGDIDQPGKKPPPTNP